MIRAALIALALATPATSATLPYNAELHLTAGPDGRPMFRPIDGVDAWGNKYAVTRPKRRPCEPLPICLRSGPGMMAGLLPAPVWAPRVNETPIREHDRRVMLTPPLFPPVSGPPLVTVPPSRVPAVPLPGAAWLLIAALAGLVGLRKYAGTQKDAP